MPTTTNFGWTTPADTDLVKDGAAAIRTLGNGIDTTMLDLKGGTTGQILSKNSNTDMDFVWIANDQGDITGVTATAPLTGGGTSGAITVGIQDGTTAQKGAVQLENSVSSTSTTTAAVPAAVKTAYDLANGAIPKTVTTTTGDIIYASSANNPARLGIGSAGQILTVSGGVPAWITPTVSTASITLIASGTLSGASLTLSSLSTYDQLIVMFKDVDFSANGQFRCRINNNSTSNYWGTGFSQNASTSDQINWAGTTGIVSFDNLAGAGFASTQNNFALNLTNCKASGFTDFLWTQSFINGSNTRSNAIVTGGVYAVAEAVSSLVFVNTGGNFDGGTYRIYGA